MKKFLYIFCVLLAVVMLGSVTYAKSLRPHHKEAGIKCNDCHEKGKKSAVPMKTCRICHEAEPPLKNFEGPPNPHDSPHYGPDLDCDNCHHEHELSELICEDCHFFDFKTP